MALIASGETSDFDTAIFTHNGGSLWIEVAGDFASGTVQMFCGQDGLDLVAVTDGDFSSNGYKFATLTQGSQYQFKLTGATATEADISISVSVRDSSLLKSLLRSLKSMMNRIKAMIYG